MAHAAPVALPLTDHRKCEETFAPEVHNHSKYTLPSNYYRTQPGRVSLPRNIEDL